MAYVGPLAHQTAQWPTEMRTLIKHQCIGGMYSENYQVICSELIARILGVNSGLLE